MYMYLSIFTYMYVYIYIYIYIYILNKKSHFKSSQIFRLFYITFYSYVKQPEYL